MTKEEILKINRKLKSPFSSVNFFEKGHKYIIKGEEHRDIKSVSSLMKYFYEPFDTENIALQWATVRNLEVEDVKLAWKGEGDISTEHGSKVHLFAEDYIKWKYFNSKKRPVVFDKQSLGALQFINDLPDYLVPVATELVMYSPLHWYSGTCDGVLFNTQNNKFVLFDYKTNNEIEHKGYFKKPPLLNINKKYNLIQDNLGKYSIQFSFYHLLLEEAGFDIQGRILVHLQEDKNNKKLYKTYKTKDLRSDLKLWLNKKEYL